MSRINFESFRRDAPDLGDVWTKLQGWVEKHPTVSFLDPKRLATELYPVAAFDLARALSTLVKQGAVKQVYRVRAPGGVFVGENYSTTEEIPKTLPNRVQEPFEVEPSNIVPVYQMRSTPAAEERVTLEENEDKVFVLFEENDQALVADLMALVERDKRNANFFFYNDITPGRPWMQQLIKQISASSVVVVFLRAHPAYGPWVRAELELAIQSGARIVPVILDHTAIPDEFSRVTYVDFTSLGRYRTAQQIAAALEH